MPSDYEIAVAGDQSLERRPVLKFMHNKPRFVTAIPRANAKRARRSRPNK